MSIFQQLTEKPWVTAQGGEASLAEGRISAMPTAKFGLRVFLCVVTVLFALISVSYTDRMLLGDWRPLSEPWLLWANTAVLVLSSVALQWAWVNARRGRLDDVKTGLVAGGVTALAFLAGQVLVSQQLASLGYYASTNPAVAFFYLITVLHGLHLLGGVAVLGVATAKAWRGLETDGVRLGVELCAVYWHFLLLVWLALFSLLLFT